MQAFLYVILATTSVTSLAISYQLSVRTSSLGASDSSGPFYVILTGERSSNIFALDSTMYSSSGRLSSQNLTTYSDIGDLRKMLIYAGTADRWIFDAIWLDGVRLDPKDWVAGLEVHGNEACDLGYWTNYHSSFTCGSIIFYFDHGYLDAGIFTLGISTTEDCYGDSTGPIKAILEGTAGISSFELTNLTSGLREITITVDIGSVYAITFESETEDVWIFDEVWLNNVSFLLPADAIALESGEGTCQSSDFSECVDGLEALTCSTSITLYLDYNFTQSPSAAPSMQPTAVPSTTAPSMQPTAVPSTTVPSMQPTAVPSTTAPSQPTVIRSEISVTSTIVVSISAVFCLCAFSLLTANFFLFRKKSSSVKQMIEMHDNHIPM